MLVPCHTTERLKDRVDGFESDAFPVEQVSENWIVLNEQGIAPDFNRHVHVSHLPGNTRSLGRVGQYNPKNRFLCLGNNVAVAVSLEKDVTVTQTPVELEAELASVNCPASPAPFGKSEPVGRQFNAWQAGFGSVERAANYFQFSAIPKQSEHQNKK